YMRAKSSEKNTEQFGKGAIRGVIAPEASTNAKDGGALVPTLAFGIPGSSEMAILLGALLLHGIEAGPQMLVKNSNILYILVFALVMANVFASIIGMLMAKQIVRVTV